MDNSYLKSTITQFKYNKTLADKTFNQQQKMNFFGSIIKRVIL